MGSRELPAASLGPDWAEGTPEGALKTQGQPGLCQSSTFHKPDKVSLVCIHISYLPHLFKR